MAINSLNTAAISGPRLADYLAEGEKNSNSLLSQATRNSVNSTAISSLSGQTSTNQDFLQISLSSTALEKMKSGYNLNTDSVQDETVTYIEDFLTEQGVDLDKITDDVKKLLSDIYARFGNITNPSRDIATDYLEMQSADEDISVFTLAGDKQRFRMRIDTDESGAKTLSVLDVNLKTNQSDLFKINIDSENEKLAIEKTSKAISTVNYSQSEGNTFSTEFDLY